MGKAGDSILVRRGKKYAWLVGGCAAMALLCVLFAVANVLLPQVPYVRIVRDRRLLRADRV